MSLLALFRKIFFYVFVFMSLGWALLAYLSYKRRLWAVTVA